MQSIANVLHAIEEIAPKRWALSFDKVGLQVGSRDSEVTRALVSLDWSNALVDEAIQSKSNLIVCHHPLIWEPLNAIDDSTRAGRIAIRLIENGIAFIACHTNWDAAPGGVNDALADVLGLQDVSPLGAGAKSDSFKLVTYCPVDAVNGVLDALEAAGAGTIGDYRRCSFSTEGTGTFRGIETSNPTVGEAGRIETVDETRLEMVVPADRATAVVEALLGAHPYEEPAYDLLVRMAEDEMPLGRVGNLERAMSLEDFILMIDRSLSTRSLFWGPLNAKIDRVAVCGGAADSMWRDALAAGADAFVTGEVKQNVAVEASEAGMTIVSAGHYVTEQPGMAWLMERMQSEVPNIEWRLFEPVPGTGGKPA